MAATSSVSLLWEEERLRGFSVLLFFLALLCGGGDVMREMKDGLSRDLK